MVDLYAVLGVSRDADIKAIRRAYRMMVRRAHPDGGGSPEAFTELKTAYDVLSDPSRRRRYDETGEFGDRAADPHRTKLIDILSVGLDRALLKLSKAPQVPKGSHVIRLAKEALVEKRLEWSTQKIHFEKAREDARQLVDRFRVDDGDNLMYIVVENRIGACQKQIDILNERVQLIDEAVAILLNTHFDAPLEITKTQEHVHELADEKKTLYSFLDVSALAQFK